MRALRPGVILLAVGALAGCDAARPVSPAGVKAYEVALSLAGPRAALAWHGGPGGKDAVYLERLDRDGRDISTPVRVTDGARYAYEPDLKLAADRALLAWYEKDDQKALTAWLSGVDDHGRVLWRRSLDAAGGMARSPVIQLHDGVILAAWIETPSVQGATPAVWTQRFDLEGAPLSAPVRAGDAATDTWNLNAAVDGAGVFYVVYDAKLAARAKELRLAVVDGPAVRQVAISADDGAASVYPDLRIGPDGQAALTWYDTRDGNEEVYLGVEPLAALVSGVLPAARRITVTDTPSIGAYLAWNGDRLGLVWCDSEVGQDEIYGQMFDEAGRATSKARRLTNTTAESSIASIQPSGKGFLIAWNDYVTARDNGHLAIASSKALTRRFDP